MAMATPPSPSNISVELLTDLLHCMICKDNFNDSSRKARHLLCAHIVCEQCLAKVISCNCTADVRCLKCCAGTFKCPMCMVVKPIPRNGVSGFQEAVLVNQVRDALPVDSRNSLSTSSWQSKHCCCLCSEENKSVAKGWCNKCHYLCRLCLAAHSRMDMYKSHKPIDLTEDLERKLDEESEETNCASHQQEITKVCMTCIEVACEICIASNHNEENHQILALADGADEIREKMDKLDNSVVLKQEPLRKLSLRLKGEKRMTQEQTDACCDKNSKLFGKLQTAVTERKEFNETRIKNTGYHAQDQLSLKQNVIKERRNEMTATLKQVEKALKESTSNIKVIKAYKAVKGKMEKMAQWEIESEQPQQVHDMKFSHDETLVSQIKEDIGHLGKLDDEVYRITHVDCPFKGHPCGIHFKVSDSFGENVLGISEDTESIGFRIIGPQNELIESHKESCTKVVFTPCKVGEHFFEIFHCNYPEANRVKRIINVGLLEVDLLHAEVNKESAAKVTIQKVSEGKACGFECNPLEANLLLPSGEKAACQVQAAGSPYGGIYLIHFLPVATGEHTFEVKLMDTVFQSPKFYVSGEIATSHIFGIVGQPCTISHGDVQGSSECIVLSPDGSDCRVQQSQTGETVFYPSIAGTYILKTSSESCQNSHQTNEEREIPVYNLEFQLQPEIVLINCLCTITIKAVDFNSQNVPSAKCHFDTKVVDETEEEIPCQVCTSGEDHVLKFVPRKNGKCEALIGISGNQVYKSGLKIDVRQHIEISKVPGSLRKQSDTTINNSGCDKYEGASKVVLNKPSDIAVSPSGVLHIANTEENGSIEMFDQEGKFLGQIPDLTHDRCLLACNETDLFALSVSKKLLYRFSSSGNRTLECLEQLKRPTAMKTYKENKLLIPEYEIQCIHVIQINPDDTITSKCIKPVLKHGIENEWKEWCVVELCTREDDIYLSLTKGIIHMQEDGIVLQTYKLPNCQLPTGVHTCTHGAVAFTPCSRYLYVECCKSRVIHVLDMKNGGTVVESFKTNKNYETHWVALAMGDNGCIFHMDRDSDAVRKLGCMTQTMHLSKNGRRYTYA